MEKNQLPENAKKVFSGVLFDVYQWEQELFNGKKATFEAVKRAPSVQIVCVTKNNKILLLEESQPHAGEFTSLPGGQVDPGEDPKNSALRELKEETGYTGDIIEWYQRDSGKKVIWTTYYYIVKNAEKISAPHLSPGEKIKIKELTLEDFLNKIEDNKFRNKNFQDTLFRIYHTPQKYKDFKSLLFN